MRRKSSEAEKKRARVREMYLEGKNFEEINKETGYAESSIKVFLKGMLDNRKHPEQYAAEIEEMHQQGIRTKDIADKIGLSYASVNRFLVESGIKKKKIVVWSEDNFDLSDLTFATPRKASNEQIRVGNKIYTDVTLQFAGQ